MLAIVIILNFQVTKEVCPITSKMGKARFGEKPFFPN